MPVAGKPILTVGMPCHDDYNGVAFTLQSLRMHHPEVMQLVEFVVVDNNPSGVHGQTTEKLLKNIPNGRYVPDDTWQGPWVKDLVFRHAQAPYVLCMDCHILLEPLVLAKLIDYYNRNPKTNDLHQGPLVYNDLRAVSTHFEPVWRGQMWGIWATDNRGCSRDNPPFEIPMQGMGLFSSRKEAWEKVGGFHRLFRGFGGEEGYIHEKYRQNGYKCWCMPWMRWWHRFDRPDGVPYTLTMEAKIRNYFIGHLELKLDPEAVIRHFMRWKERPFLENMLQQARNELDVYNRKITIRTANHDLTSVIDVIR